MFLKNVGPAFILFFSILLTLVACTEGEFEKLNIRSFYYPVERLQEPLVYEYGAINNDSLGAQYWYLRTMRTDTATYFTANLYNESFEVEQFSVEEEVSNGMLQKDYFLYAFDSTGMQTRLEADIAYDNAFPFDVADSNEIFLQKMTWTFGTAPLHTTTLIRNRRYIGDREYVYKGKTYEAISFSVREVIDDFYDGHLETETSGMEVYAKGLGLVYYKKKIGDALVLEYKLKDTYTMEALEAKFSEDQEIEKE